MSLVVEFDMDGVIADIYTPIENIIKQKGYKEFSFNNVKTYECRNSGIGCPRAVIYKLLFSPEIYNLTEPVNGTIELFEWLFKNKCRVVINTKKNKNQYEATLKWIGDLQKKVKNGNIEYVIDTSIGTKEMLNFSDILIEDCLENLSRSTADVKFLMSAHHNKPENNKNFEYLYSEVYKVNNLLEIKQELKNLHSEVFIYE